MCFLVRVCWVSERDKGRKEREDGLVVSNDYSELNLFLKLEVETTRLNCIIKDVFPLTAMKTDIKN